MKFETKLTARDIECAEKECAEDPTDAIIIWTCEFEFRSWGVKSIEPFVEKAIVYFIDNQGTPSMREFTGDSLSIRYTGDKVPVCPSSVYYNPVSNKCVIEF